MLTPDGYTILLATNAWSVNVSLYTKIPYDPLKDFVGVSELATSPNTFVVKSDLPAKTMKEFVALARANPDKFNCATPPIGTTPQIQLEVLKIREKLPKLEDVVFKGGGDAIQALLSGTAQLSSGSLPPAAPHIKAGTLALPRGHRRNALAGLARRADHAGGRLQGLRVRDRHRVAGAGQDAAGNRRAGSRRKRSRCSARAEMKEKLYKSGFQVRPKGAKDAWARVTKEIDDVQRHHRSGRHQETLNRLSRIQIAPAVVHATAGALTTKVPACRSKRSSRSRSACR